MCPPYQDMINSKNHKFDLRIHLVRFALDHSLHAAARQYQCSRNTVRKWLRRYQSEGLPGLEDKSRAPKSCPHKTTKAVNKIETSFTHNIEQVFSANRRS